ncbi:hypothetical protein P3X46_009174 [Hevea brasiliensis]|uniref:Uncharacterized protein n=1 Tax=Hevea brasiliensis TaxID=3981 RepID=A0ABQ9ML53_HEVBR|nr:hypothetical protein P3X46_009174 [Hevea brasiliensis]
MTCLLEWYPLNLPVLMIHTMTMTLKYSTSYLPYGHVITKLLQAFRVDLGIKAAMTIPRDYDFYTMDTLPHMGLGVYQDMYEHAKRDRHTPSQRPQTQSTAARVPIIRVVQLQ